MIITHQGQTPQIDPSAWVAPDATLCGAVTIGPGARVLHGARVIGESGGRVSIGTESILFQNAVIRATRRHNCTIGNNCLIGPQVHITGATIGDECYIATGAAIFPEAQLGRRCEIRVGGIVHLGSVLPEFAVVPNYWIAVGSPVEILPPDQHESIWARQKPLDFPRAVFGVNRASPDVMIVMTRGLSEELASHRDDQVWSGGAGI
ncbi:MAG: gamma carbonic anhydrase family protein [Elstera sp.]